MKNREQSFSQSRRRIFRPPARMHDPMLALNRPIFSFTDGWSRTLSKPEYVRFDA
jgi:hypothetical protein